MSALEAAKASSSRNNRPLACKLCQQRKIKCDRSNPCGNCLRSGAECQQAIIAPRRRRFPERALLDRLRRYEELLREHKIPFDSMHASPSSTKTSPGDVADLAEDGTVVKQEPDEEKLWWQYMSQLTIQPAEENDIDEDGTIPKGNVNEGELKAAMDSMWHRGRDIFFSFAPDPSFQVADLHPLPALAFRLFQTYIQNIDAVLKVTHIPTLQPRVVELISNPYNADASLHALMFGIYCISICSMEEDECQSVLACSQEDALSQYQRACRQALFDASFLRTSNIDCLLGLYLYLMSSKGEADPRALSSILAAAIRIAHRMGISSEAGVSKFSALEQDYRRRLWFSIVIFDARMCEMTDFKTTSLTPLWDCKVPTNVNDVELRPESKLTPPSQPGFTEATLMVIRCEIAEVVRNANFHLEFTNPLLKSVGRMPRCCRIDSNDGYDGLVSFEQHIETKYLSHCSQDSRIQFFTTCFARSQLSKHRLLHHYGKFWWDHDRKTDAERDESIRHARDMLEYDTRAMASPLTSGLRWILRHYLPVPGYFHLFKELQSRPLHIEAMEIWATISDNFGAHRLGETMPYQPFFQLLRRNAFLAWEAREEVIKRHGHSIQDEVPMIIKRMRDGLKMKQDAEELSQQNTFSASQQQYSQRDSGGMDSDQNAFAMPAWASMMFGQPGDQQFGAQIGGEAVMGITDAWMKQPQLDESHFDWTGIQGL